MASARSFAKRRLPKMNNIPAFNDRTLLAPVPFGYKTAWFAIFSEDMNAVATALKLKNPQAAN
jgi:hypothetical protein